MKIARTVAELNSEIERFKSQGKSIGLVPTMGALHEGHLSLIRRATSENDVVVASIFVNPTQFNNPEDLEKYPRTEKEDIKKLEGEDVALAFIPSVEEVYPEKDTRVFDLGPIAEVMEGKMRPGHFNGVAQIVSKLFDWTRPDNAYFGKKDFQQIAIIKRLVEIGNYKINIVECPIAREEDGLARSSRNVRLSESQRKTAPIIHRTLNESKRWMADGLSPEVVTRKVISAIDSEPEMETEYFTIIDSRSLMPIKDWGDTGDRDGNGAVGCIAVYCGDVRLIDYVNYMEN